MTNTPSSSTQTNTPSSSTQTKLLVLVVGVVVSATGWLLVQSVTGGARRDVAIAQLAATVAAVVKTVDGQSTTLEHLRQFHESK